MTSEEGARKTVFDKIRDHYGREIAEETEKFRWRYTTLQNDFQDLLGIRDSDIPAASERSQQLQNQGYVFEVERRLHHYLSGLYTLVQQQQTLQTGVGQSFREDLHQVENDYRRLESSRAILGLRHFVQHENVLPLQVRISKLDNTSSLVVMLDDLHRQDGDRDFGSHFGHIDGAYFDPVNKIEEDWENVEVFYEETIQVINKQTQEERGELQRLNEEVDSLYEKLAEDYRELKNDDSD